MAAFAIAAASWLSNCSNTDSILIRTGTLPPIREASRIDHIMHLPRDTNVTVDRNDVALRHGLADRDSAFDRPRSIMIPRAQDFPWSSHLDSRTLSRGCRMLQATAKRGLRR